MVPRGPPVVVCLASLLAGSGSAFALPPAQTSTRATIGLEEAYETTRRLAPEPKTASERILQAELQVRRAWALLLPNLNAQGTYTKIAPEPNLLQPDFNRIVGECQNVDLGTIQQCFDAIGQEFANPSRPVEFVGADTFVIRATINWNLLNGRALPLIKNARSGVELEQQRAETERQLLMLSVTRAYYTAVAAKQTVETAEAALHRAEERTGLERRRAAAGDASEIRLKTAELTSAQARLDHDRAKVAHEQALLALAFAIGSEDTRDVVVPPAPEIPAEPVESLLGSALARPDVRAARTVLLMSERSKSEVWWRFAPTLSLFGSYRWSNIPGLSNQNNEWAGGVAVNWALYDGGLRYADLQEAESRIRVAQISLDRLERSARTEIKRSQLRVEQTRLGIDRAKNTLRLAEEKRGLVETQLDAGLARSIDLEEANEEVREAQLQEIRARLDHALSVLELQYAAGRFDP